MKGTTAMADAWKIRTHQKLALCRELAEGKVSQNALAEKYGVTHGAISQFKTKNIDVINSIQADFENEFAGLWTAKKANRIALYQKQVEQIEDILEQNPNHPRLGTMLRYSQAALDSIAREMNAYTVRVETNNTTTQYIVDGVDTEAMK